MPRRAKLAGPGDVQLPRFVLDWVLDGIDETLSVTTSAWTAGRPRVFGIEKRDHRTRCFVDDRGDVFESVLVIEPQPDEGDLCACASTELSDTADVDVATNDLMAKPLTMARMLSSRSARSLVISTCK